MSEVASLNIDLSLLTAKFQEGCARAKKAMTDFEKSVKPIARSFTKFGNQLEDIGGSLSKNLTLPLVGAGVAIGAAVNKMASFGGEINDMAVRTGFSREALQELKFAADQTGVSMDSIEGATRKLTKAMGDAASGNGKTADLFNQLGISIKNADGSLRPANEVFADTLDALNRIPDEATRNVVAMELMGKSAGDLTPLIKEGKEGLARFGKEARDAGLIMSEEAVIAADEFGDKMDKVKSQLSHAGMEIGSAFMPVIEQMIGFIQTSVIPAIKQFADWFKNLSDSQKTWVVGIGAALAALGPFMSIIGKLSTGVGSLVTLFPKLAGAMSFITGPVGIAVAAITGLFALIQSAADYAGGWENLWEDMKVEMDSFVMKLKAASDMLLGFLTNNNEIAKKGFADYTTAVKKDLDTIIYKNERHAKLIKEKADAEKLAAEQAAATEAALKKAAETSENAIKSLNIHLGKTKELTYDIIDPFDSLNEKAKSSAEAVKNSLAPIAQYIDPIIQKNREAADSFEILGGISEESANKMAESSTDAAKNINRNIDTSISAWDEYQQKIKDVQAETQRLSDQASAVMQGITGIFSESMTNQEIALDNRYGHERMLIENSTMDEQAKARAIKTLDNKMAADRKAIMQKKAKAEKAQALFSAIVAGAAATTKALEVGPYYAAAIAALAAIQIGYIASRPIPQFEHGGLVMGETMGIVGEGRGTSRSNPEVIAPLDKLMGFLGGGDGDGAPQKLEFVLSGETLRAVLDRNNRARRFLGNG